MINRHRKLSDQLPVKTPDAFTVEVRQGNLGMTYAEDRCPVLATVGLFTCIGLAGYDKETRLSFLMHIQPSNDVVRGLKLLGDELEATYPFVRNKFEQRIISSLYREVSNFRELEEALRSKEKYGTVRLKLVDMIEFVLDERRMEKPGEGVAIDSNTGYLFTYLKETSDSFVPP